MTAYLTVVTLTWWPMAVAVVVLAIRVAWLQDQRTFHDHETRRLRQRLIDQDVALAELRDQVRDLLTQNHRLALVKVCGPNDAPRIKGPWIDDLSAGSSS